jgi:hypothetical protein
MCRCACVQERIIQRLIRYEPLLGMATMGICMQVPVVSMRSIMQLMNGHAVTNQKDLLAMRKFVQDALDSNNMVQYMGMDAYGSSSDGAGSSSSCTTLPGYITCRCLLLSRSLFCWHLPPCLDTSLTDACCSPSLPTST